MMIQSVANRFFATARSHQHIVRRTSLFLVGATTTVHFSSTVRSNTAWAEPKKEGTPNDEKKEEAFDITNEWEKASKEGLDFFQKIIYTNHSKEVKQADTVQSISDENHKEATESSWAKFIQSKVFGAEKDQGKDAESKDEFDENSNDFFTMATNFAKLSMGDKDTKEKMLQDLVVRARASTSRGDFNTESSSFSDVLRFVQTDLKAVADSLDNSFGHISLTQLTPTSLFYFLELEDERKNPSWKRRMHRFHRGIDIKQVSYLNDMLQLSELSYADSVEDIAEGIKRVREPLELIYCDIEGKPNQPGHFIALKKDQSIWSSELEVVIVIRGTKTVTDVMTDLIVDAVDYRGGKAHSGILESGKWLVNEHKSLLQQLKKLSKKRNLKITLVGHSLGAGAATIAGMEFNDMSNVSTQVVGFGCPSLLNPELGKSVEGYVTTVIADSDIVPRMSAATVANVLLDMMEYDWTPRAREDIAHALGEAREAYPSIISESTANSLLGIVDDMLQTHVKPTIKKPTTERAKPVLAPPGMCVHLYTDGSGVSGSISPGKFFQEIDITRSMAQDHLTMSGYQWYLLTLMRQYTHDNHFAFDLKKGENVEQE